jgi:hypothetical protein
VPVSRDSSSWRAIWLRGSLLEARARRSKYA